LSITRQQRSTARRSGLFEQLEKSFGRHFYDNREDALNRAKTIAAERKHLENNKYRTSGFVAEEAAELEAEA
jgi:DNA sulfur modification protein DndC